MNIQEIMALARRRGFSAAQRDGEWIFCHPISGNYCGGPIPTAQAENWLRQSYTEYCDQSEEVAK